MRPSQDSVFVAKIGKWKCLTLCPLGPREVQKCREGCQEVRPGWSMLPPCLPETHGFSSRAQRRVEWNSNKRSHFHFLISQISITTMVMMMASFLSELVWSWRSHWWLRTMPLLAHAQPMCCISQVYFSHVYFSGVFFKCIPQVYFSGILFKCIPGCALVGQCLYSLMHNPRCATCINPIGSTNWPFQRTQRQEQIWFWFTEQINGRLRPNRINWGGSKRPTPTFCKSVIHANFVWTPNASSKMIRRWKTWSFKFYFNLFCFRYGYNPVYVFVTLYSS